MAIKFTCPEGHALSAPEKRSGTRGKCPKCNSEFVVPEPADAAEAPASTGGEDAQAEPTTEEPADADDVIVFLCPNGHKLNGPSRLQGKPGQCPHCGEKFRIPSYEDDEDDEDLPEDVQTGAFAGADHEEVEEFPEVEVVEVEEIEEIEELDDLVEPEVEFGAPAPVPIYDAAPPPDPSGSSISHTFQRFWQHRNQDDGVEIHLEAGPMMTPDYFAPGLSQRDHAVFATQERDGSFTIDVVPWDKIKHISYRKLQQLPNGVFS